MCHRCDSSLAMIAAMAAGLSEELLDPGDAASAKARVSVIFAQYSTESRVPMVTCLQIVSLLGELLANHGKVSDEKSADMGQEILDMLAKLDTEGRKQVAHFGNVIKQFGEHIEIAARAAMIEAGEITPQPSLAEMLADLLGEQNIKVIDTTPKNIS